MADVAFPPVIYGGSTAMEVGLRSFMGGSGGALDGDAAGRVRRCRRPPWWSFQCLSCAVRAASSSGHEASTRGGADGSCGGGRGARRMAATAATTTFERARRRCGLRLSDGGLQCGWLGMVSVAD